jgi:tetratricopeptide (TPR) repeat protein
MKQALILLSLVAFALTTNAQRAKVTTAILSIDANDFGKAKSNIDDAVLDEKTSVDPKAWFYRGQIYQHLSQIALGTYVWKPGVPIEQPEIEEYKVLAENPAQTAFESYKKCLEVDAKGKYRRKVDENLKSVLAITAFSLGNNHYQEGNKAGNAEELMKAHANYGLVLEITDFMSEGARTYFVTDFLKQTEFASMDLVRLYMGYAAYNAKNYEVAKKEFKTLADKHVEEIDAYRLLAYIYKLEEDNDARRELYTNALNHFPLESEIGKALAVDEAAFYQEIGELETLMEKLNKAIEANPDNASLYNVLGGIYAEKCVNHNNAVSDEDEGNKEDILPAEDYKTFFGETERLLTKAQELAPAEPSNYSQLGRLYLSEGLVAYNQNQRLGMSKSDLAKGKILEKEYREAFAKAIAQFDKALKADPENVETLDLLAKTYAWNGDTMKSVEAKNKIKEIEAKK